LTRDLGDEKKLIAGEGGKTDKGDGLFLGADGCSVFGLLATFVLLVQRADKAGSLDLLALPRNFAMVSSNEGNNVLDPKVGVPHLEIARPAISLCVFPISGGARLVTVGYASPSPPSAPVLFSGTDPTSPGGISPGNAVICPK